MIKRLIEKLAALPDHGRLASLETGMQGGATIDRRVRLPRGQAAIALACNRGSLGIVLVEVRQDSLNRSRHVVNVEAIKPRHLVWSSTAIDGVEVMHQLRDDWIAPHPRGEAREGARRAIAVRAVAYRAVEHRRIGPVGLDRDYGETVPLHEPAGDRCAGLVKLACPMAALAEHHHALAGKAIERFGKGGIVDRRQFDGVFADQFGERFGASRLVIASRAHADFGNCAWQERNKTDRGDVVACPLLPAGAGEAAELLHVFAADRHDQTTTDLELLLESLGDFLSASGNQNGVERRPFGQANEPVAGDDFAVVISQRCHPLRGFARQRGVPFDSEDLIRDARNYCCGVSRPRADLEHPVPGTDLGSIDHRGDDVGLADRLPFTDRQRTVFVGELAHGVGNETLARNRAECLEKMPPAQSAPGDLAIDHRGTLPGKVHHRVPSGIGEDFFDIRNR